MVLSCSVMYGMMLNSVIRVMVMFSFWLVCSCVIIRLVMVVLLCCLVSCLSCVRKGRLKLKISVMLISVGGIGKFYCMF